MTEEKPSDAAAEWADTQRALQAAYNLLDSARERETMGRQEQQKLHDTIKLQANALAKMSADKSVIRRALEYLALLVILSLAAYLLYLGRQLQLLLG